MAEGKKGVESGIESQSQAHLDPIKQQAQTRKEAIGWLKQLSSLTVDISPDYLSNFKDNLKALYSAFNDETSLPAALTLAPSSSTFPSTLAASTSSVVSVAPGIKRKLEDDETASAEDSKRRNWNQELRKHTKTDFPCTYCPVYSSSKQIHESHEKDHKINYQCDDPKCYSKGHLYIHHGTFLDHLKKKDWDGKKLCKGTLKGKRITMKPKWFDREAYEAINPPINGDKEEESGDGE